MRVAEGRVLIIGAGPSGLFLVFQLGLLGIAATLVDALPRLGGQCSELYADKPIYDVPAIVRLNGAELAERLWAQCKVFDPALRLATLVNAIEGTVEQGFRVEFSDGTVQGFAAVVVAAGVGAFVPRRLRIDEAAQWEGSQLSYGLPATCLDRLAGQQLVVSGAGERGLDLIAQVLQVPAPLAPSCITLVHRSAELRLDASDARAASIAAALAQGRVRSIHGTLVALHGEESPSPAAEAQALAPLADRRAFQPAADRPTFRPLPDRPGETSAPHRLVSLSVQLRSEDRAGEEIRIPVDRLVICHGLSPRLAPLLYTAMGLRQGQIPVDSARMESQRKGIFVIGDLAHYPGKQKLIVCGFHEATLAAYASCDYLFPGKKIHLQYTTTSPRLRAMLDALHPS